MTIRTKLAAAAAASITALGALVTAGAPLPASAAVARAVVVPPGNLPQTGAAVSAANWVAGRFTTAGYIPTPTPGQADLSDTAESVLSLAVAGVDLATARAGFAYLSRHVDAYAVSGGTDDPGALAVLILGAHALGDNPRDVGGSDLVARLQATVTTKGQDAGLYGAQDPTYDGAYRQGLALVALAAAGVKGTATAAARGWLTGQQCATDGGWEAYRTDLSLACTAPDPSTYSGPDTNSTALAIEGLAAQGAAVPASVLTSSSTCRTPTAAGATTAVRATPTRLRWSSRPSWPPGGSSPASTMPAAPPAPACCSS